jgi:hypothetical protein
MAFTRPIALSRRPLGRLGYRHLLWGLIATGTAARLLIAFTTHGHADLGNASVVYDGLRSDPLHVYDYANRFYPTYRGWPYPPGFFPWILVSGWLKTHAGVPIEGMVRVALIASDAAIAWLVQYHLGRRGVGAPGRLLAVGLVALGPSFAAISGYHGQIDSVAILPAVAALVLWERTDSAWRPYAVGALIGAGGAIKTVPLLMLIAILPSARSWREGVKLTVVAVGIPLALLAPFLLFGGPGAVHGLSYHGGPGLGGLSLVTAPGDPPAAFGIGPGSVGALSRWLFHHSQVIVGVALTGLVAFLWRRRPSAPDAACLLWLAVFAFGINFYLPYVIWGLPFFLLAGYLRQVVVLEALLLAPTLVAYALVPAAHHGLRVYPWEVSAFYTAPMILAWVAFTIALVTLARRSTLAPLGFRHAQERREGIG